MVSEPLPGVRLHVQGEMMREVVFGIDVSKEKLDVCWLRDRQTMKIKTKVFPNQGGGFAALVRWAQEHSGAAPSDIQVMMEATGIYHEALAYALYEAGFQVFVANPQHAHSFVKSFGRRSKNDRKDSVMLARFLTEREHPPWQPEPSEIRYLKAMLARLHALDTDLQRERNRLETAEIQKASARVEASIHGMIRALEEERDRLKREIDDHIDGDPGLKRDRQLLESIPGIGRVLSVELLVLLRSRDFTSAGQAAAFVGLIPIMSQSGSSVELRPRLSKAGSGRFRAKVYMGAIVATRHNPSIRRHYQGLLQRGKAKMSALGAAMRKLVQLAYGVLKHQAEYDPQWAT